MCITHKGRETFQRVREDILFISQPALIAQTHVQQEHCVNRFIPY